MKLQTQTKWFVLLEFLIYVAFNAIDFASRGPEWIRVSVALKLLSILLCLIFLVVLRFKQPESKDNRLMVWIMGLTFASDLFLLLTRQFIIGLILFVTVQLLYSLRIKKRLSAKMLILYGSFFIAVFLYLTQIQTFNVKYALMLSLGVFYALLFCVNIFALKLELSKGSMKSGFTFSKGYDSRLFAIGLILYALCDINVAIYNFPSYFDSNALLHQIYKLSPMAMWLFYLPGQVALTLSVRRKVDGLGG